MPTTPTDSTRPRATRRHWLGLAALATATSLTISGCGLGHDDGPQESRRLPNVGKTEQPVDGVDPGLQVLRGDPVGGSPLQHPRRPNLLMITVDDAAIGDLQYMPLLQRHVADRGVTLENGLAPTPICVPARASLLTGQYARNHGALTIEGEGGGFDSFEDDETLPVWLREADYDTLFLGKYLNGYGKNGTGEYVPPGWTDWRPLADPSTYNFAEPIISDNGTLRHHEQYSTDLIADLTVEMLTDPDRQKRPWYFWVNYVGPHHGGPIDPDDPRVVFPDDPKPISTTSPAQEDQNTFDHLELPDLPNLFEEDPSDKVLLAATRTKWSADRRAQLKEAHQQRIEALQSVDRAVARTVATLRETGQLDNTYLVFTSDNGHVLGTHNIAGKLWYFHDIVTVPMLVRGPGLPQGARLETPVTNADWAPTFAALAGVEPTRDIDGVDVSGWLDGEAETSTRVVPIEAYPVLGGTRPIYTGVVVGDWTYVERKGRAEMYYRAVDPFELNNLNRDPRYRAQRRELRDILARYVDCAGDTCPKDFYR